MCFRNNRHTLYVRSKQFIMRETEKQTDSQTDRVKDRQRERQIRERQTKERQIRERQTKERQIEYDKETTYRQKELQGKRQTDSHTE